MEGYIEFCIASMLNTTQLQMIDPTNRLSSVYTGISLAIVTFYPIFLSVFLVRNFKRLEDESVEQRYGALYEGLKPSSNSALLFYLLYMLRRVLFAVLAIFAAEIPIIQAVSMVWISLLLLVYLVLVKPFEKSLDLKLEIVNEATILISCYHLFLFTDYLEDKNTQQSGGTSLVVFTLCNIIFNTGIMFWQIGKQLKEVFKKLYGKFRERYPAKTKKEDKVVYLAKPSMTDSLDHSKRSITILASNDDLSRLSQEKQDGRGRASKLSSQRQSIKDQRKRTLKEQSNTQDMIVEDLESFEKCTKIKKNKSQRKKKIAQKKLEERKTLTIDQTRVNLLVASQRKSTIKKGPLTDHSVFRKNIDIHDLNKSYLKRPDQPSQTLNLGPKDEMSMSMEMNIGMYKN